ncbi:hypothetical protein RGQ29_006933 [Quercus rubra]|uniref:Protein FRA10AC1 n=1 Tax=Quercus rubra TaxID=3512 RepID=A0AAN7E9K9_QUERU|nr:hypothetical protein RGQ29_006933 [Quercus rubra]
MDMLLILHCEHVTLQNWQDWSEMEGREGSHIWESSCGNKHCDEKDDLASYETSVLVTSLISISFCGCADKLHYKRQKEKEQSEKREQAENKRKRNWSRSIDETDNDCEGSKDRRKGKKASISTDDHKVGVDDNFDEFLEGMFP